MTNLTRVRAKPPGMDVVLGYFGSCQMGVKAAVVACIVSEVQGICYDSLSWVDSINSKAQTH